VLVEIRNGLRDGGTGGGEVLRAEGFIFFLNRVVLYETRDSFLFFFSQGV
jgi:hypothetical protein